MKKAMKNSEWFEDGLQDASEDRLQKAIIA
jgi:hypothetical protein